MGALLLRNAVPLFCLGLVCLAWGERCVPALGETFGEGTLLRFVVGVLCLLVYALWIRHQQLADAFSRLMGFFKDVQEQRLREGAVRGGEQQRDAVRLLVASLSGQDEELRSKSVRHLERLTGQRLGVDPEVWRRWLASQSEQAKEDG